MRVDLGFEKGQFRLQFLIGDLLIALLGPQPVADDFYTCAEDEDQQEDGDITWGQQGLLKITGFAPRPGRPHTRGHCGLEAAEKEMVDPGEAAVEDQQGQDGEAIDGEFFSFQPFRYEEIGIEIIEDDQQDVIGDEEGRKVALFKKGEIPGPWVEYEGYYEEADPGCCMYDDLD